jgi:hypothetical protein
MTIGIEAGASQLQCSMKSRAVHIVFFARTDSLGKGDRAVI